jgi:sugar transferase EpsL
MGKRLSDIIIAILGIILLSPLIILIGMFIYFIIGTPVLFRQVRPGLHGSPFVIYKFRTMASILDENKNLLPDADRLTMFGRFLRIFSLDELPEFFNVLKGDMSIVGPRPLLMEYLMLYSPEQSKRHDVKPGITGWAQINGRNAITWEEKFLLDVWYVDNRSFWLDAKIMLITIWKIFMREGVNQPGHATMKEFKGKR